MNFQVYKMYTCTLPGLKVWELRAHALSLWVICVNVKSKRQMSCTTMSIFLKESYCDPDLKELD